jgi:hypothetical protein
MQKKFKISDFTANQINGLDKLVGGNNALLVNDNLSNLTTIGNLENQPMPLDTPCNFVANTNCKCPPPPKFVKNCK